MLKKEMIRKGLLIGVGVAAYAQEKTEKLTKELYRKNKLSKTEGKKLVRKIYLEAEKSKKVISKIA